MGVAVGLAVGVVVGDNEAIATTVHKVARAAMSTHHSQGLLTACAAQRGKKKEGVKECRLPE